MDKKLHTSKKVLANSIKEVIFNLKTTDERLYDAKFVFSRDTDIKTAKPVYMYAKIKTNKDIYEFVEQYNHDEIVTLLSMIYAIPKENINEK